MIKPKKHRKIWSTLIAVAIMAVTICVFIPIEWFMPKELKRPEKRTSFDWHRSVRFQEAEWLFPSWREDGGRTNAVLWLYADEAVRVPQESFGLWVLKRIHHGIAPDDYEIPIDYGHWEYPASDPNEHDEAERRFEKREDLGCSTCGMGWWLSTNYCYKVRGIVIEPWRDMKNNRVHIKHYEEEWFTDMGGRFYETVCH